MLDQACSSDALMSFVSLLHMLTAQHYSFETMLRTVFFCVLGFTCFVVPIKFPADYW